MQPQISWETIDSKKLSRLPYYKLPPTYKLQRDPGNGCFLDPPGYPTYYTRSIYTSHGNSPPHKLPQMLLNHRVIESGADWNGCKNWDEYHAKIQARLKALYKPLPLDHPRVRAWIKTLYAYFKHCYQDPGKGRPKVQDLLIWPIPGYQLKTFHDDPRFSDEWREKEKAAINQANTEIIEAGRKVAIPENHRAVKMIREFYPEYEPEIDLIERPPAHTGDWWERYAEQMSPEDCPGLYGHKHPASGSWCQMCGWHETV